MHVAWGKFSQKTQGWLKIGWLLTGALVALHFRVVMPRNIGRGIRRKKQPASRLLAGETGVPLRDGGQAPWSAGNRL